MIRALQKTPGPIIFVILSFLCPTELSVFVADMRLPPHRIALLMLFPFVLMRLLGRPDIHVRSFDIMMALFASWLLLVYDYHGASDPSGLVYGGSLALESLGGYLVARAYVRDAETCTAVLKVMMGAIAVSALIALPETLLGQNFAHDVLQVLTGYHHPTGIEARMGLTRAYGTFDHPIHYGTFCAALLALLWFADRRLAVRRRRAALVIGATVLGMSAAPLLCIFLQSALMIWERVTRTVPMRTALTVVAIIGLYIGATLVSDRSPINFIATGLTFNSWTGFYRLQIWEHGLDNVWGSPWIGIGLAEWNRPAWMVSSTVDAFWLVTAMRSGIPSFLLLACAIGLLVRAVVLRGCRTRDEAVRRLSKGWMISLIALCLVGTTVHFWNVLHAYFFFFLGLAGWIANPARSKAASKAKVADGQGPHARHQAAYLAAAYADLNFPAVTPVAR